MHFIVCFLFNFNKDLNLKIDDADTSLTGLLFKEKLGKNTKNLCTFKVLFPLLKLILENRDNTLIYACACLE